MYGALLIGCASQAPPGGGPEDKTAPSVVSTFPPADSTGVSDEIELRIEFSEKMDEASTEGAVFVSPRPTRKPKFSWDGRVLTLRLPEGLRPQTTCVVTVGTAARDRRNNALRTAFTFAFSTGDSIDRGVISGQILSDQKTALPVWAYRMEDREDSSVFTRRADYVTQSDADGRFRLSYLAPGRYRIVGVADLDEDGLITAGSDFVAIAPFDPVVEGRRGVVSSVNAMMHLPDTTKFAIVSAVQVGHEIRVTFSKALSSEQINPDSLSERVRLVPERSGARMFINSKLETELWILAAGETDSVAFGDLIAASGDTLADTVMPIVKEAGEAPATWIEVEDPTEWSVPRFSATIRFSRGMDRVSVERSVFVKDTSGHLSTGTARWMDDARMTWHVDQPLSGRMMYRLCVRLDSIVDWTGRRAGDSTFVHSFQTVKADTLGLVSGGVEESGRFLLQLVRSGAPPLIRKQFVDGPTKFVFGDLLPGRYTMTAYRDDDRNSRYSYGSLMPFRASEPFLSYADTIVVRSNWETSNVNLRWAKP